MSELKHAICYLSVAPVRKSPSDTSEMVTQLIFGDLCNVIGVTEDSKWLNIRLEFDGYEGWVDPKQIKLIEEAVYLRYLTEKPNYLLEGPVKVAFKNYFVHLSIGSYLPQYENETFEVSQKRVPISGVVGNTKETDVVVIADMFLGVPYLWGGKSQFGIDCSGLVQQVFKVCGKTLPRDAHEQAECGEEVAFENLKAGDLAFFKNNEGKIHHVGIVLDFNNIIHAHGKVRLDLLDNKGVFNTNQKQYSHQFAFAKRIFS